MNDTTTIKQLSAELHISEQALRQYCRKHGIQKETFGKLSSYFLNENDVKQIRLYYQGRKQSETETKRNETFADDLIAELRAHIDSLKADKEKEIAEKENINKERQTILIELLELRKDNKQLQTELNEYKAIEIKKEAEQAQISELTAEVKELKEQAEQAQKEKEKAEQVAAALTARVTELETAAAQEPQKKSLWSRLFKRKQQD